jgi:hypothetical protein
MVVPCDFESWIGWIVRATSCDTTPDKHKACNYYTPMAEITARSTGWKDKSAQKINAACIRRHLSAAVRSGTSIAGTAT